MAFESGKTAWDALIRVRPEFAALQNVTGFELSVSVDGLPILKIVMVADAKDIEAMASSFAAAKAESMIIAKDG